MPLLPTVADSTALGCEADGVEVVVELVVVAASGAAAVAAAN
jgi:hypothetical protein